MRMTERACTMMMSLLMVAGGCGSEGGGATGAEGAEGEGEGPAGEGEGEGAEGEGEGAEGEGEGAEGEGEGAEGEGEGAEGEGDAPVGFAAVHEQILVAQGCTAGYCHGGGQGGLLMTDAATSYANLVGVEATTGVCGLSIRVVPGEPDQSIAWLRARPLALDDDDACTGKMPQGSEGLDEADAELVRAWIAAGAPE